MMILNILHPVTHESHTEGERQVIKSQVKTQFTVHSVTRHFMFEGVSGCHNTNFTLI